MSAGPKPAELALAALLVDIGGVLHCAAASEREKMLLAKHQAALGEGPLRGDAHAACLAELVTESLGHLAGESPGGDDLLGWSLRAHAPWSTDDRIVAASVEIASGRGGKRGAFETPQAASARAEIATLARALRNDACSELTGLDIDAAGPALLGIIERHLHGLDAPHAIDGLAWPRRARWAAALAGALASVAADGTDVAETPVALVHLVCPGATRVEARNLGWAMLSASGAPRLGMVELDAGAAWIVAPAAEDGLDAMVDVCERSDAAGVPAWCGWAIDGAGSFAGGTPVEARGRARVDAEAGSGRRLRRLAEREYDAVFGVRPPGAAPTDMDEAAEPRRSR